MTRSRASAKKAGTAWETAIVRYLCGEGWTLAERRARTGALDQGDITGIPGVCIEAKNTNRITLGQFLDEAETEAANANADIAVAWVKRRGKASPADGYVILSGKTFADLLRGAGY